MSTKDIKTFARKHSASLGKDVLSMISAILEKHNAAIIEYCCEQQSEIEALKAEAERYKSLYYKASEGRRHFREALRAARQTGDGKEPTP